MKLAKVQIATQNAYRTNRILMRLPRLLRYIKTPRTRFKRAQKTIAISSNDKIIIVTKTNSRYDESLSVNPRT